MRVYAVRLALPLPQVKAQGEECGRRADTERRRRPGKGREPARDRIGQQHREPADEDEDPEAGAARKAGPRATLFKRYRPERRPAASGRSASPQPRSASGFRRPVRSGKAPEKILVTRRRRRGNHNSRGASRAGDPVPRPCTARPAPAALRAARTGRLRSVQVRFAAKNSRVRDQASSAAAAS